VSKIHLEAGDSAGPMTVSLCGWTNVELTHDRDAVTCNRCKRRMHREIVGERKPEPVAFDPTPYPIHRQTWEHADEARRSIDGVTVREGWDSVHHALRDLSFWFGQDSSRIPPAAWAKLSRDENKLRPLGERARSSGDGSSATDRKLHTLPVERAMREACAGGYAFAGGEDGAGALTLAPEQCSEILFRRARGEEAARFAELFNATPVQVGIVYREKSRAIESILYARGLLPRARASHSPKATSSNRREGDHERRQHLSADDGHDRAPRAWDPLRLLRAGDGPSGSSPDEDRNRSDAA
jgi:hypothetical protein